MALSAGAEVAVSAVQGNSQSLDGGAMFGNVPRVLWQKWMPPDAAGRIELATRALLIECQGVRILCETGIGAFFEPKLKERYGVIEEEHRLLASLHNLRLSDCDIDYVILSHLHFDHAGGLLPAYKEIAAGRDELLFPKAKYVVGREAWQRATQPHYRDRASFIPGLTEKLERSGRLVIVEGAKLPGVFEDRLSFRYTSGHTPGHMHTVFRGNQRTIIFCGDLIPGEPWVHLPVTMGYDRYPELLIDEKEELYAVAEPEGWWLFFTHDMRTAVASLGRDEKGNYRAVQASAHLVRTPL